jgi:oligoribonuclease
MNDRMVWIDCEMTGLDLHQDALIEVAALVTDSELNVLGTGIDVVIKPPPGTLDQMADVVREMHTASGLLDELEAGVTLNEAEDMIMQYVQEHVREPRRTPLCGNSVATDRGFLARDMPTLEKYLHYRIVDVSSIKELARRWYPRVYFNSPEKTGNHRALADIRESIAELKYYREAIFVPQPGPDSATARSIAETFIKTDLGGEGTVLAEAVGGESGETPDEAAGGTAGEASGEASAGSVPESR